MNNLTSAKQILQEHGLKPNKLMGQTFLIDGNVMRKILAAAALSKKDVVLEVGPGLGALTQELIKYASQVIAIEKDKKMVDILKEKFREAKNIEIIQGDILKEIPNPKSQILNKSQISNQKTSNYKVVANIPYYLTSHLIRKFLELDNPPREMILMIQKEVAQRICSSPPRMSLLAVAVQFYATTEICAFVSKNSFWPQPKVDSAIIKITPYLKNLLPERLSAYFSKISTKESKGQSQIAFDAAATRLCSGNNEFRIHFFSVIKAGFSHPRKQLINNLSRGLKMPKEKTVAVLKKIGLAPEQRAETLKIEDWIKLTALL